jgi:hypothetical protein
MEKRKYSHCIWCGRTIDVTNQDRELCNECNEFDCFEDAMKHYNACPRCRR